MRRLDSPLVLLGASLFGASCADLDRYTVRSDADAGGHQRADATALDSSTGADGSTDAIAIDNRSPDTTEVSVGFGSIDDLSFFRFYTPPDSQDGPASWTFFPSSNPHLVQTSNVNGSPWNVITGTRAIYEPRRFKDGVVSVSVWSSDISGTAGLLARYLDDKHYYRFRVRSTVGSVENNSPPVKLERIDGNDLLLLDDAGTTVTFSSGPVELSLEVEGAVLRGYINGRVAVEAVDENYSAGQAAMTTIALFDAHFDDFAIRMSSSSAR